MEGLLNDLTIREAAVLLKVSEPTVRRWVASGKLPATRRGRALRIQPFDLEGFSRNLGPPPPTARPGSAAALLEASEQCSSVVPPDVVDELERLIAEGCERPGEAGETLA